MYCFLDSTFYFFPTCSSAEFWLWTKLPCSWIGIMCGKHNFLFTVSMSLLELNTFVCSSKIDCLWGAAMAIKTPKSSCAFLWFCCSPAHLCTRSNLHTSFWVFSQFFSLKWNISACIFLPLEEHRIILFGELNQTAKFCANYSSYGPMGWTPKTVTLNACQ